MSQSEKKRLYDRNRAKESYSDFKVRRARVIQQLGGACVICDGRPQTFHLHHKEYHPTESSYSRHSKDFWTRFRRLKEAEAHPERFALMCAGCHNAWGAVDYLLEKVGLEVLVSKIQNIDCA